MLSVAKHTTGNRVLTALPELANVQRHPDCVHLKTAKLFIQTGIGIQYGYFPVAGLFS